MAKQTGKLLQLDEVVKEIDLLVEEGLRLRSTDFIGAGLMDSIIMEEVSELQERCDFLQDQMIAEQRGYVDYKEWR